MTEPDLLAWGLEHYFSVIPVAVDQAKKVLGEKGMDEAVECLRRICVEGSYGDSGPGKPAYSTRGGMVLLWNTGNDKSGQEPDLVYDLHLFCRWKLGSLYQVKML